ncbi:hypothetical protein PLICRDRAFT_553668 [Plicaturopsis crispa FD-325 SS-3]|nr:hypothetical protein PLICRDRAFT_553668 [Plicaturopsis crispa FD-325 SS-3]
MRHPISICQAPHEVVFSPDLYLHGQHSLSPPEDPPPLRLVWASPPLYWHLLPGNDIQTGARCVSTAMRPVSLASARLVARRYISVLQPTSASASRSEAPARAC